MRKEVQAGVAAPAIRAAPPGTLAVELCCPPLAGPGTALQVYVLLVLPLEAQGLCCRALTCMQITSGGPLPPTAGAA